MPYLHTNLQNAFSFVPQGNIMSNIENTDDTDSTFIGRTHKNENDISTSLTIPLELARELDIENSRVSMSLIHDYEGNKNLLISKFYREIVLD